jgi:hypothetical protein
MAADRLAFGHQCLNAGVCSASVDLDVQRVEPVAPETGGSAPATAPTRERCRVQRVHPQLALHARADETLLAQDPQVARDARSTRRELRCDLTRAALPLS